MYVHTSEQRPTQTKCCTVLWPCRLSSASRWRPVYHRCVKLYVPTRTKCCTVIWPCFLTQTKHFYCALTLLIVVLSRWQPVYHRCHDTVWNYPNQVLHCDLTLLMVVCESMIASVLSLSWHCMNLHVPEPSVVLCFMVICESMTASVPSLAWHCMNLPEPRVVLSFDLVDCRLRVNDSQCAIVSMTLQQLLLRSSLGCHGPVTSGVMV